MSTRSTERVIGACFLLVFLLYAAGGVMVDSGSGNPALLSEVADHGTLIASGALLMLANSVVVATIGVLLFPVLRRRSEISAVGYLVSRSVEAVMLAVGTVFLLLLIPLGQEFAAGGGQGSELPALARVAQQANAVSYQAGMLALSIGGVVLCRVLLRAGLVPRPLALVGLVGYAALFAGSVLEVLGYAVGTVLSVPGGLFELALGVLLIARGFTAQDSDGTGPAQIDLPPAPAALSGV